MREELVLQNRIKEARTQAGLSQTQLAELVGVSRSPYRRLLSTHPMYADRICPVAIIFSADLPARS